MSSVEWVWHGFLWVWVAGYLYGRLPRGGQPLDERLRGIRGLLLGGVVFAGADGEAIGVRILPDPLVGYALLLAAAWLLTRTRVRGEVLLGRGWLIVVGLSALAQGGALLTSHLRPLAFLGHAACAAGLSLALRRVYEGAGRTWEGLAARWLPLALLALVVVQVAFPGWPPDLGMLKGLPEAFRRTAEVGVVGLTVGPWLALVVLTYRLKGGVSADVYDARMRERLGPVPRDEREAALETLAAEDRADQDDPVAPRWGQRAFFAWTAGLLGLCVISGQWALARRHAEVHPGGFEVRLVLRDLARARGVIDSPEHFARFAGRQPDASPAATRQWLDGQPEADVLVVLRASGGGEPIAAGRFRVDGGALRWEAAPSEDALAALAGVDLAAEFAYRYRESFPARGPLDRLLEGEEVSRLAFGGLNAVGWAARASDKVVTCDRGGLEAVCAVWVTAEGGRRTARAAVHPTVDAFTGALPAGVVVQGR
jgi:hypothetical protein